MNVFKSIFQGFTNKITPVLKEGGKWWYSIDSGNEIAGMEQYLQVPELVNVISIRARAMASGYMDAVSKATGNPAPDNQSLVRVLRNPNYFQSYSEFWRQSDIFRSLYGNEYIYFLRPVGMPNTYKGMFTLNPANVLIEDKSDGLYFMTSELSDKIQYKYRLPNGKTMPLDRANIIHLNDNRFSTESGLFGTSKLISLAPALNNIIAAYRKRGVMLNLPAGVFRPSANDAIGQAIPFDETELKQHQSNLRTKHGNPIITNLNTTYESMAADPASMGLFEEIREDLAKICDAYGVPYEVLASQKGVTFANLKEAKKQMYEETIIPDAKEKVDALNMAAETASKSWEVKAFWEHLPVFSEDKKANAQTYNTYVMGLSKAYADQAITIQEYRDKLKAL